VPFTDACLISKTNGDVTGYDDVLDYDGKSYDDVPVPVTGCDTVPISRNIVRLGRPFRAITSGQFAVFYKGDELMGSAKTLSPGPLLHDLQQLDLVKV
jgi:predicted ThiF/HesA family dinucleotide-utilizing enzyme